MLITTTTTRWRDERAWLNNNVIHRHGARSSTAGVGFAGREKGLWWSSSLCIVYCLSELNITWNYDTECHRENLLLSRKINSYRLFWNAIPRIVYSKHYSRIDTENYLLDNNNICIIYVFTYTRHKYNWTCAVKCLITIILLLLLLLCFLVPLNWVRVYIVV